MIFGMIFGFSLYTMPLQVSQIIYILEGDLGDLEIWERQKIVRYVITSTGRVCQFWLIFRIKLIQCKLLVYILGILPKVVIWNRYC